MNEEMKKKIEKEAKKEYSVFMVSNGCSDCGLGDYGEEDANEDVREAFITGAEYGYNLAKEYIMANQETNENLNYVTVEQLQAKYNIELRAYFKQSKEK